MPETQKPTIGDHYQSTAIVIVTYNRSEMLENLFASVASLDTKPNLVVVIDNASTDGTPETIDKFVSDNPSINVTPKRMPTNTGGAGGFHMGVKAAYEAGSEWIWVMDDDVIIKPDALEKIARWGKLFLCFHGKRTNPDGTETSFQHTLSNGLGIAPLSGKDTLGANEYVTGNSGCFEGMVIHRSIVEKIGFPDKRYFIAWDDAAYGWEASQFTPVAYVNDTFLDRQRDLARVEIGGRTISARNDLGRFYAMRNRALLANKFDQYEKLDKVAFGVGTTLTFIKESAKTLLAEKKLAGMRPILRGTIANRKLSRQLKREKTLDKSR